MASSLSELLAEDGFHRRQKSLRDRDQPIAIPLYICQTQASSKRRDTKSSSTNGSSSVFSSRRVGSVSERSNSKSSVLSEFGRRDDPAIDEVSVRAVVSILSGYVGRYVKDEAFRVKIREKCLSCLVAMKMNLSDHDYEVLEKLEMGMESADRLVEERGLTKKETQTKIARNTIQVLSIVVASLNNERDSNPHLSSCAQLYLAILYKLERNDMKSARHLLEVFCESPFVARTHLVPDLWEHFFLPHLLHLKVWFAKEMDCLSDLEASDKEKKMKAALSKAYNEQVDLGTIDFALYYKKWLKVGAVGSPAVPVVPLPARPYRSHRRPSMDSSSRTHSSLNKNLYKVVFGSTNWRRSENFANLSGSSKDLWDMDEEASFNIKTSSLHENHRRRRRSLSHHERSQKPLETWREAQKPENFRFFACRQSLPLQLEFSHLPKTASARKKEEAATAGNHLSAHFTMAAEAVCSSDSLPECEAAVRTIAGVWLESRAEDHPALESALSRPAVVEGLLEVLLASGDDEVLELALSILAELVTRAESNRLAVLNADPRLEVFRRHLRSSGLFLKAASLLYLTKPVAKQMVSPEWVPLVLRVMEFGGQPQALFTVRCSPSAAAFYLLGQLLAGFDDDGRNLDNARQVVSLGGLGILAGKVSDEGGEDSAARLEAAKFVTICVRADGSCRNYLAESLSVGSLVELVVIECRRNPGGPAFSLLVELLCLNRRTQINSILEKVKQGWGGFNTMHILFAYLQRAKLEDRPLIASVLLQLDLLEDPSKSSIFREEAVEAIISSLDCHAHDQKVQQNSARALLMLGGRFSYTGEASTENWLLEKAGFNELSTNPYRKHERGAEEEAEECWQRKAAAVLFKSGGERLLAALSDSIDNGIPSLSRASLITASWMFVYLRSVGDQNLQLMACSVLVAQLVDSLSYDKDVEGRVIASYSLLNLTNKSAECASMLLSLGEDQLLSHLKHLRLVTWTADELLSTITS